MTAKKRKAPSSGRAALLGLSLLLAAGLYALFFPQSDFSTWERRYLSSAPSAPSVADWRLDSEAVAYLSDRVPLRHILVNVDSSVQALTGRRTQLGAWPAAGALVEEPLTVSLNSLERRLKQFGALAEEAGCAWSLIVPPTHGYLLRERMEPLLSALYERETPVYEALSAEPAYLPLNSLFAVAGDDVYYQTDHHWTLKGAYLAYSAFCAEAGRTPLTLAAFRASEYGGFRGTTWSRSGLPWPLTDTLRGAEPDGGVTLTISDNGEVYDHLLFPEQAGGWDGYALYLNGNHGTLTIENPAAPEGTLLVFKDSFANCLLPLLSGSWRTVIAVDARYEGRSFRQVISEAGQVDRLLFVYSADSVMNDTVVARKAR